MNTHKENILKYLKEVVYLKYKTYYRYTDDDTVIWFNDIPENQYCTSVAKSDKPLSDEWLNIKKVQKPQLPSLPEICGVWVVESTLYNFDDVPSLYAQIVSEIETVDGQNNTLSTERYVEEKFDKTEIEELEASKETGNAKWFQVRNLSDELEIQKAWNEYIENEWFPWTEKYLIWQANDKIYKKLYLIHQEKTKSSEDYELLLSIGQLTWILPSKNIQVHRHIIAAKAHLEFTPTSGRFTLVSDFNGAELKVEYDMLEHHAPPDISSIQTLLDGSEDNPWDKEIIDAVLKAFVNSISDGTGIYENTLVPNTKCQAVPEIHFAPALVFRKRRQLSIQRAIEELEQSEEMSTTFRRLTDSPEEIESGSKWIDGTDNPQVGTATSDYIEPLLPLPHNKEQRSIVDKINRHDSILVQGPPGTGKSLTIANLICHLLSQGKKILVTAQTAKALRVLKDKIPEELQGLCVNLLGEGRDEREEFKNSIQQINHQWSCNLHKDENYLSEVVRQEKNLHSLKKEKAAISNNIAAVREKDSRNDFIAGSDEYSGSLTQIAIKINENEKLYNWMKDDVDKNIYNSIVKQDFIKCVNILEKYYYAARGFLDLAKHTFHALLSPTEFEKLATSYQKAIQENQMLAGLRTNHSFQDVEKIGLLVEALSVSIDSIKEISRISEIHDDHQWLLKELPVAIHMPQQLQDLKNETERLLGGIATNDYLPKDHLEANTDVPKVRLYEDLKKLSSLLNDKKKVKGLFGTKKIYKPFEYILKEISVRGYSCDNLDSVERLIKHLELEEKVNKLANLWKNKVNLNHDDSLKTLNKIQSFNQELCRLLKCAEYITKANESHQQVSDKYTEPDWTNAKALERLLQSCKDEILIINNLSKIKKYNTYKQELRSSIISKSHSIYQDILTAIENQDVKSYAEKYEICRKLNERHKMALLVQKNIALFNGLMPLTCSDFISTCNTEDWKVRFSSLHRAAEWAHAVHWLNTFEAQDLNVMLEDLKNIENNIKKSELALANSMAWRHALDRITENESRALRGFTLIKVPKTGKSKARKLRESQQALNECKNVIPALIMPLYKVYDTVTFGSQVFDIVIIDESSQCSIDSIPVWSLGKKVIVVGDNRQISPESIGIQEEKKVELPQRYLHDLQPVVRRVLAVESNMYDIAEVVFPASSFVRLLEHFRCMPEIIGFNNKYFYSDKPMIPLKRFSEQRLEPPVKKYYVDNGYTQGSGQNRHNPSEVEHIVDTIVNCCNDSAYEGMTMGVISLQGHKQYKDIENALSDRLLPEEIARRRIVCGNSYSFQGDERDVIFLSMVIANDSRYNAMTKDSFEKIFNVAVSRAKDQIWVFHSVKEQDLSSQCLRRKLLEYFGSHKKHTSTGIDLNKLNRDANSERRTDHNRPTPFDSWFEVDVFLALANRGYHVIPQYEVAGKYIDIVVEGYKGVQLAVECDGDYYHTADNFLDDIKRQADLERLGWEFFRIKEWEFRKSTGVVIEKLISKLNAIGLKPISEWVKESEEILKDFESTNSTEINTESKPSVDHQPEHLLFETEKTLFTQDNPVNSKQTESSSNERWPDPRHEKPHVISERIIDIVEEHGPMLSDYAHKIYISNVGLRKLGRNLKFILDDATRRAIRTGRIEKVQSNSNDGSIIKAPGQKDAVIRRIDERDFYLIPSNEIQLLSEELKKKARYTSHEALCRAVLNYYGVGRFTTKVEKHLMEIL